MYAIIADGGRQYKVEAGSELELDYRESVTGDELTFDKVLALGTPDGLALGAPHIKGAVVKASVLGVAFGPKLIVQKFRRRKTYRRKNGHRQMHTRVRIESILPNG